ncbi:hypothetical protein TPL01_21970 [Sulfuriferula plumbiphila]|uniref:Uncharacterized protein n=1 Tax=Sulfuriferula plumbiphila TaxID=171865 RepID=A0A512L9A1_9PROT|nr:hypothetical protein SFPGR_04410 [Sulfuriferula plumbiphila]GEP31059.1 hypothetical protein TPL01_21970 [Sulfuriferula plumbiphila]
MQWWHRVPKGACVGLEPDEGKLSSPVLRGMAQQCAIRPRFGQRLQVANSAIQALALVSWLTEVKPQALAHEGLPA